MMNIPPSVSRRAYPNRRQPRLVDWYARWEYGMPDASALLTDVEGRRGSRRARRLAKRSTTSRMGRGALHPLRFLAFLIAPRQR